MKETADIYTFVNQLVHYFYYTVLNPWLRGGGGGLDISALGFDCLNKTCVFCDSKKIA